MKNMKFCVTNIVAVIAVAGVFLCAGCNDGGVESGGGDAVAYLKWIHGKSISSGYGGEFTDSRNGKTYNLVTIDGEYGSQTWMAENLNYAPKDGNSKCYNNDESYCNEYGRLYDWETALTVCPDGWRLPFNSGTIYGDDFFVLQANLDAGGDGDGNVAGYKLKAKYGWERENGSNKDGNGTDDVGFKALPGGHLNVNGDGFEGVKYSGYWWVRSNYQQYLTMYLRGDSKELITGASMANDGGNHEMNSVRCLLDD